ncbi:hypothetical protein IKW73_01280 [Candidatus Saccharibacteria bacterium]|nr:hypothetical protein [Candidatus Saccharibacteria bacterium]
MSGPELTSVAYKKGNWMRYSLWAIAGISIAVLIGNILGIMNSTGASAVPEGYKFSITDRYNDSSNVKTIYYVYDDKIIAEDESFDDDGVNRVLILYDGISTSSLKYDGDDTTELCELGACKEQPKVLAVIKRLISRKVGREYIGY